MARSRNIKPGFFTNDVLGELPALTRLLFAGMWTICDRAGRLEDRPKKIRAEVLPYDDCDPEAMLQDLEKHGFILRYEAGGVRAIQVLAWEKHQNPHVKEGASTIPAPIQPGASMVQEQCSAQPSPERAGLIPDSGFLTTDSSPLIPEVKTPRKRSAPPSAKPTVDVQELLTVGFPPDVAAEFIAHKAAMKAPLTERAWADHLSESKKAGWTPLQAAEKVMAKNWKGFEAKYVVNERPQSKGHSASFADHDEQVRRRKWEEMTGRKWPDSADVLDIAPATQRIKHEPAHQGH